MPPSELHLRAMARGERERGGLLAYGRERAGESALLSAGRRALRAKGGMTVSAQRASGGPTGYPPASAQPCAARCGRALTGGAPAAQRCARPPLLPASTARWGNAKPLGSDGQEQRSGRSAAKDGREVAAANGLRRASGGRLRRGAARDRPRLGVRCGTASLKRAPAEAGRSRDRLKSRPQLLRGVRMAGYDQLLRRCPLASSHRSAVQKLSWARPSAGAG